LLYLGVALHKTHGKEEEALKAFRDGFRYLRPGQTGPNTELWARGSMSRLLRKMGRISEAEKEESAIRHWIKGHPYGRFHHLVVDPAHEGKDYIIDHPEMVAMMAGMVGLPGGMVMHVG